MFLMLQYSPLASLFITVSHRDQYIEDTFFRTNEMFKLLPEVIREFLITSERNEAVIYGSACRHSIGSKTFKKNWKNVR